MAKKLTVLVSDELYNQLVRIKGTDEVQSIMEHVRSAIRLYLWYREQVDSGFSVYAKKEDGDKTILREILLK
ncbi:MAG TPA: hypothetical protein VHY08_03135 [Bacillota bacterium]|nr:hypothetical protein [Bacillota bacterium]